MKRLTFALAAVLMLIPDANSFGQSKPAQTAPAVGTTTTSAPADARITGVLKAEDGGAPIAGATVVAWHVGGPAGTPFAQTDTDKDGKFEFSSLPAGKFMLTIEYMANRPGWVIDAKTVMTLSGKTRNVTLKAVFTGVIEITVLDEDSGKPLANAYGVVHTLDHRSSHSAPANDKGVAVIRKVPGEYYVGANVGDCSHINSSADLQTVIVEGSKIAKITIKLKAGPLIKGVVKDVDGKPVAGAVVTGAIGNGCKTDASGKLSFHYASNIFTVRGNNHSILVRQVDRGLVGTAAIEDPDTEFTVMLDKGLTLKGAVTDANDKPIKGATVRTSAHGMFMNINAKAITDDKGRYEIPSMPKDVEFVVLATAEAYGQNKTNEITIDNKTSTISVDKLQLPMANLEVSGTVRDEDGKVIVGVNVCVGGVDQPDINTPAVTDKDGRFTVKGLVEGPVSVNANTPKDGRHGEVKAEAGDTDVLVTLQKPNGGPAVPVADDADDFDSDSPASKPATGPASAPASKPATKTVGKP